MHLASELLASRSLRPVVAGECYHKWLTLTPVIRLRAVMRDERPDEPDWLEWGLFVLTAALAFALAVVYGVKFLVAR